MANSGDAPPSLWERQKTNNDASELRMFLEQHKVAHYTEVLLNAGYSLTSLDLLTQKDCRKLRITNKNDVEQLAGLGQIVGDQKAKLQRAYEEDLAKESAAAESAQGAAGAAGADGALSDAPATQSAGTSRTGSPVQFRHSAQAPTANEYCRQATNYLDYRRIDRSWPLPGSNLARVVGLSTAKPFTGSTLLYTLLMPNKHYPQPPLHGKTRGGHRSTGTTAVVRRAASAASGDRPRWQHVNQRGPVPPELGSYSPRVIPGDPKRVRPVSRQRHIQGVAARNCPVCKDHALNCEDGEHAELIAKTAKAGTWQYRVHHHIILGDGKEEHTHQWRPFSPVEAMKLEDSYQKHHAGVMVSGKYADFKAMLWGGKGVMNRRGGVQRQNSEANYKPIRRVPFQACNFPSLKQNEVIFTPDIDPTQQQILQKELDQTFLKLIETEEERARFGIVLNQTSEVAYVLAEIAAMMEELFAKQRLRLEDEETAARKKVEDEYFTVELDKLWTKAERSVKKVTYDAVTMEIRRTSDNVMFTQFAIMDDMEQDERRAIEEQEKAERANMDILIAKLNRQIRDMMREAAQRREDDKKNSKFKISDYAEGSTLRCTICKQKNCTFFKHPWRSHWQHRGGVLDLDVDMRLHTRTSQEMHAQALAHLEHTAGKRATEMATRNFGKVTNESTVAGLMRRAAEKEYKEYQEAKKARAELHRMRLLAAYPEVMFRARTPSPQRSAFDLLEENASNPAEPERPETAPDATHGGESPPLDHPMEYGRRRSSVKSDPDLQTSPRVPQRPTSAYNASEKRPPFKVGKAPTPPTTVASMAESSMMRVRMQK